MSRPATPADCASSHGGVTSRPWPCCRELGLRALREGRFANAEGYLKNALKSLGRRGDLYDYLASLYARTGRPEACAAAAESAARCGPADSAEHHRRRAQALWQAGRRCEAQMVLSKALRRLGDRAELHLQRGLFHAAEQEYADAREALSRAVALDASKADAHYYLGLAAAADGDAAAAIPAFQRALELRPADVLTAYQLALAARGVQQQGRGVSVRVPEPVRLPSAAGRELARYVTAEPDFVEAFLSLPESDVDEQLFGLLGEVLETALAEHPGYADLHRSYARVLARLGRLQAAQAHARRAVEINPGYLAARLDLAHLCERLGREEEALAHLRRAVAGGADWPDVHCFAGRLLKARREATDARRHLRRALELNPSYREAAEELNSLAA